LQRLFDGKVREIRLLDRNFRSHFQNFETWFDTFRNYFGPVKMLFDNLPEDRAPAVREEMRQAIERYERATDGTIATAMSYVNVIIRT
jgi:hypothetical protein